MRQTPRSLPRRLRASPLALSVLLTAGLAAFVGGASPARGAGAQEQPPVASWQALVEPWVVDHPPGLRVYRLRIEEQLVDAERIEAFRADAQELLQPPAGHGLPRGKERESLARERVDSLAAELARVPLRTSVTETLDVEWPAFKQSVDGTVTEGEGDAQRVRRWKLSNGRDVLVREVGEDSRTRYRRYVSEAPHREPRDGLLLYQGSVATIRAVLEAAGAAAVVTMDGPRRFALRLSAADERRAFERLLEQALAGDAGAPDLARDFATEVRGVFQVQAGRAEFVLEWLDRSGAVLLRTTVVWRDAKPLSVALERYVPGTDVLRARATLRVAAGWPGKAPDWTPVEGALVSDTRFGPARVYPVGAGGQLPTDEAVRALPRHGAEPGR